MDPRTAFDSPRREEIIASCATSRVCRRCAGNTMILDTQPIRDDWQAVDKFGFGWHPFESYLFGIGGRWTSGSAQSYFYTRIESVVLSMEFRSPFPSATKFQMLLSAYDPATKQFSLEHSEKLYGRKDQLMRADIPVKLRRNTFYRLTILSPTFSPQEFYGAPDTRRLGLAVSAIRLGGRPYGDAAVEACLNFAGAPSAPSSAAAYAFPILS
jgi:hypothetical protein